MTDRLPPQSKAPIELLAAYLAGDLNGRLTAKARARILTQARSEGTTTEPQ